MGQDSETFVGLLASRNRVLLLGGMAIIAHGLNRSTMDVDVWLEPFGTSLLWVERLLDAKRCFSQAHFYDLFNKTSIADKDAVVCIERDCVIRIAGLDRPVDLFRIPNNLEVGDFELCWQHSVISLGDVRVMDEVDLLVTKEDTSRDQDAADIAFLERRIRNRIVPFLLTCNATEADSVLARYADPEVCRAALANPSEEVRTLAGQVLGELMAGDDSLEQGR